MPSLPLYLYTEGEPQNTHPYTHWGEALCLSILSISLLKNRLTKKPYVFASNLGFERRCDQITGGCRKVGNNGECEGKTVAGIVVAVCE